MTSPLVDFHCHLDLYPDFTDMVRECETRRVLTLAVTTTPQAWFRNRDLALSTKHVRAALGLHPQLVGERWREIDLWLRLLPETRYVGEVGLDAGPAHYHTLERQKDVFRTILQACAADGDKILSIHSVRAVKPTLDMLEEHLPLGRSKVVLHWFTGTPAEARRAVGLGCHFSVNAPMLRNERGCKLISGLPQDRLLTETDGPFTKEDGRPSRPWDVETTLGLLLGPLGLEVAPSNLVASNLKALLGPTTQI